MKLILIPLLLLFFGCTDSLKLKIKKLSDENRALQNNRIDNINEALHAVKKCEKLNKCFKVKGKIVIDKVESRRVYTESVDPFGNRDRVWVPIEVSWHVCKVGSKIFELKELDTALKACDSCGTVCKSKKRKGWK